MELQQPSCNRAVQLYNEEPGSWDSEAEAGPRSLPTQCLAMLLWLPIRQPGTMLQTSVYKVSPDHSDLVLLMDCCCNFPVESHHTAGLQHEHQRTDTKPLPLLQVQKKESLNQDPMT